MAEYETVAIVGVGLIGGSIGRALRERKLARRVIGVGRRESSLKSALKVGAIDRGTTDLTEGVGEATLVVVCTPVDLIPPMVVRAADVCPPETLITDAGSTKQAIVAAVEQAMAGRPGGARFVGSHPLAGDDRGGPQHARADLLKGRTVVVTPTAATPPGAERQVARFWQILGAKVLVMDPAAHDAALATTSHLPHLVAAALAATTPDELLPLAASGWRDTTRVAGGDPRLWKPILATNREHVVTALDRLQAMLVDIRAALAEADDKRLLEILQQATDVKRKRDALGD